MMITIKSLWSYYGRIPDLINVWWHCESFYRLMSTFISLLYLSSATFCLVVAFSLEWLHGCCGSRFMFSNKNKDTFRRFAFWFDRILFKKKEHLFDTLFTFKNPFDVKVRGKGITHDIFSHTISITNGINVEVRHKRFLLAVCTSFAAYFSNTTRQLRWFTDGLIRLW